jgi:hypothetical protein
VIGDIAASWARLQTTLTWRREMKRLRLHVLASAALLLLLAAVSISAQAAPPPKNPIVWNPASVDLTVSAGTSTTSSVSFSSSKKLGGVTITASGQASSFLTLSPASLKSVDANTPVSVSLAVAVPANATLRSYQGTVQVSSNRKAVADPLPVTINVVAPGGGHIYWNSSAGIGRADLDGSNPKGDFIPLTYPPDISLGVAVDSQHIYWTETASPPATIGRANLDGSGADPNFIPLTYTGFGGSRPQPIGIAVDAHYIYWADADVPAIARANLDGTDVRPNFIPVVDPITGAPGLPVAVAVDANHIYWVDQCRTSTVVSCVTSAIGRADLDGSNAGRDFIPSDASNGAWGIAVDAQHVYWANNYYNSGAFTASIGRANLDGTNPNQSFITRADSFSTILGVTVDSGHIYWGDSANNRGTIARANLDGSNQNLAFIDTPATFIAVGS